MKRLADELNKTDLSLAEKFALLNAALFIAEQDLDWCQKHKFGISNMLAIQWLIDPSEEDAWHLTTPEDGA